MLHIFILVCCSLFNLFVDMCYVFFFLFLFLCIFFFFFFSSRRRHTRWNCDWSSDVCSSDLLSVLLGGNYVNRFSIQGRSYKVIPQVKRTDRLTPDQLSQMYITGGGGKLVQIGRASCRERV